MSNTVRKENDWLLARTANPQMSVDNFEEVGLNATNTSLETEDTYAKSQTIQNMPEFLTDGVFDKNKFHAAYVEVQSSYNELAHDTYLNELNTAVNYYKDDIFAPDLNREQQQRRLAPETGVIKLLNPMLKKHSNLYLGSVLDSDKSMAEIMQSNRVLLNAEDVDYEKGDFSKAKWGSSINDISLQSNPLEYFKSWGDTYVQAVWHEDGTHIDPTDGLEKEHHKGDYKINADGDYFYEKANGRDVYNEKVLSRWDYLTVDGTKANTFDFMDSDDKKKSWYGTLTREIFELAPLFIPYVGPAYMTARLGIQAASVANTVAKMASDNFNLGWEWTNKFEGFNKALEQGTSEYSLNNTVTAENLISMAGLVATLLLEQRAIFKSLTAANSWIKNGKNLNNEKGAKELFSKFLQKYLEDARHVNGAQNVNELVTLSTKYASAEMKALQKQAQAFGEEASRLYMTGFTVMDAYNEAKENGASDTEAAILTLGYAAAEYGILKTDVGKWIMPEQKMERIHLRNVVRTLTEAPKNNNFVDKNIKTNWAKSLMQKAAKACKADYEGVGSNPTVKDWIGAFASNALSEGIEETSEELAYDLVKTIGNAVSYVIGSDTDYKPFENGLSNYGMSFLGGFFGGGLALIDPSFRKALKFDHNMTYDHAFLEFVGMIGEGKANDLREAINKTPVSNQFLTKTNPDTPSITMQDAQGGINDNMDKQSKNILLDMVDFCENVLNKHSVNITQSLLLQESTYLRDLQADALANSSFAAGYIKKFNKARTDLIEAEINYYNATHPENVVTSKRAEYEKDHEDEIKKAREAVVKADEEVLKYINGEYRPILIRGVMKEMMPDYVKPYGISNVDLYAQVMYGKSFKDLSDSEKAEAQKSWENFKNTEHQDHMISVDEVSHGMAKVVSPLLANIETDYFGKVTSDKIKKLNNLIETRRLYTLLADENALMEYASREAASQGINPAGLNYNDEFYKLANRLLSKGENLNSIDGEISPEVLLASAFVPVVQEIDPNLSTEELEEIRQQNQAILDADPVYQHIKEILSYKDPGALGDTEALIAAKTEKVQSDRLRAYIAELMLKPVQELTKETFLRLDKAVNDKLNSKEFLDTIEELVNNLVNEANNAIDEFNLNAPEGEPKKEHLSDNDITRIRKKAIANERKKFISEELPKIRKEVIGNFNVDSIYDLVQDVIKQGFVHPELRSLLMQGLNYAVDYVTSIDTGEDSTLEKYKQEQLDTLSEQMTLLNELPSIPIIDILDKFLLGITDGTSMSISDILKKADDILKAPDIGDVMLSDPEVKALQDGVSVLQMFDALLLGATSDDVTIEHRISLNAMINALEELYGIPKEKRSNLATLPSNIVALIRLDLKPILGKLQFMLQLNALNSGQKAKNQNKVSTKGYKIMYSKIYSKLLGHTIDDSWDKDGALNKLKAALDGLDLLLLKTANYSKEGMIAFEKLRIAMENALYDFMQANKDKSIEEKAALFAELAFDDNERQILTTDTENLSDALFMYWFMAVTGVKGDSFLNEYKKAYTANPDLAPFASLELGIRLAYTALLNGDYISQFVNAVRDVIKNKYKNINKINHDDILWLKDFPYEASFMPRYLNTILIEGVPGSGKSKGILKMLVLMARNNEELNKALLNNVFVAHISKKEAEDLGTGSGFKKDQFTAMDRQDLLKYVTGGKYDTDKLVYEGTTVKYDPKDFTFNEETGLFDYNVGIAEGLTNIPSLLIIDEIGRYTTVELDILDKFARKYGIQIIAMGDLDLTRTVAKADKIPISSGGTVDFEASLYRGNFIHGIKLGLSVRAANNLKALNQKALQTILPTLKGLPTLSGGTSGGELASALRKAGGLKLRYLENDKGLYGDKIVGTWGKELSQEVKDSIENMFRTAGKEKIGFAYRKILDPDNITPLQKYLFEGSFTDINGEKVAFKDRLDLRPDGNSLGSESKYYIIEPDAMNNLSPDGTEFFWTSLYTGMSRSKQGSLIVLTEINYRGLAGFTDGDLSTTEALVKAAQLVSSVKSANKVDDTLTNTMIKAIAANRTAILDNVLTGDIETPKFVKRENYSATPGAPKKVEKAPDQVLKGSDNQPFVPDNTPSENKQFSDDFDLLKEDGTLNLISYTHSALEVGAIKESDGTYVLPPNAQDRIDGVNGLVKILRPETDDLPSAFSELNADNALINKFINILNACKYNVRDYNNLVSKILQELGDGTIVDSVEITYVKMSLDAHNTINDRRSRRALILDVEEELINAWKGERIEKATPQVAKLGYTVFTKTKDGKKASLFIPMLTLPNFITIFTSSKFINPAAGSIYEDLLKLWIDTNQYLHFTRPENTSNPLLFLPPNQSKIRDLAIELNKRLNNYIHNTLQSLPDSDVRKKYIKSIQALSNLIKLFEYPQDTVGFTGNNDIFTQYLTPSGPFIQHIEKGVKNYMRVGYESNTEYRKLSEFAGKKGLTISKPMISYTGQITVDGVTFSYVDPGKPFVLVSDLSTANPDWLKSAFLENLNKAGKAVAESMGPGNSSEIDQRFAFNFKGGYFAENIPEEFRRIKIVYVVPPTATVQAYCEDILKALTERRAPTIGNDFDIFRILAIQEKDAEGKEGLEKYVLYNLTRPKGKDGKPLTSGGLFDRHKKVFELINDLQKLEELVNKAKEEGDIEKVGKLQQKQLEILRGDVFSGESKPFNNKANMNIVLADAISHFSGGKRVANSDKEIQKVVSLIEASGIKEIYYNPTVDKSKLNEVETDPIIELNEISGKEYTINGDLLQTALFGNMSPIINALIANIETDIQNTSDAYFDPKKKFILSENMNIFSGEEINNKEPEEPAEEKDHKGKVKEIKQRFINGLPSNRAFFNKNMRELIEDYDNDAEEISTEYLVQKAEELKRYYVLTAPLGEPDCKILYLSKRNEVLRNDFMELENIIEKDSYAGNNPIEFIISTIHGDLFKVTEESNGNLKFYKIVKDQLDDEQLNKLTNHLKLYIGDLQSHYNSEMDLAIGNKLFEWFYLDLNSAEQVFGISDLSEFINRLIAEKGIEYVMNRIKSYVKDDSPFPLKALLKAYEDYINGNDDSNDSNNGLDNKGSNSENEKVSIQEYLKPYVEGLMTDDMKRVLNDVLLDYINPIKDINDIPKEINPYLIDGDANPLTIDEFMRILREATYDGGLMPEPILALTNAYEDYINQDNNKEELNKNDGECAPKIIPTNSIEDI